MKSLISYLLLFLLPFQFGCKAPKSGFIKSIKEHEIILESIEQPFIKFVLDNKDTILFGRRSIINLFDQRLSKEVSKFGYSSSKHLAELRKNLSNLKADTTVYQNLSAVGSMTISDNLDGWIARELLLDGKAIVALKEELTPIMKLKYVYVRDVLGGEQGTFYTPGKRLVYRAIISLGE